MSTQFNVVGIKKDGGTRHVLGVYDSNVVASEAALTANMDVWEDVFVETDDGKPHKAISPVQPATIRDSRGLRDALFDEIDNFRKGKGDPQRAVAISKLASQILASAKLEHEIAKYSGSDTYNAAPLQLGGKSETN